MARHQLWRLVGAIVLLLIAVSSLSGRAPERAQASVFDWAPVGDIVMIDVPGAVNVIDLNPFRPGKQTFVIALHNQETGAFRVSTLLGRVLAEGPAGGFRPQDSLWTGWRLFLWGKDTSGSARLWTPRFDAGLSFAFTDPDLSCRTAPDANTPIAGPFTVTVPTCARPGGKTVASPAQASVFARSGGGVRIATADGVTLAQNGGGNVAQGGFELAGAVFAFGTAQDKPVLWTPEFLDRSTGLARVGFLPCDEEPAPASGQITVTKVLVPETDSGRFDLNVDGVTWVAGVGDGGNSGAVTVTAGDDAVAEAAAAGTSLDDYTSQVVCTEDSNPASPRSVNGPGPLSVPVAAGDAWACTITNTLIEEEFDGDATVTLNQQQRTSALIGPEGGMLSTGGMTLVVPEGALPEEVEIGMTPIALLSGTPIDGSLIAGAHFSPDGLTFLVPATMTLALPPGVAAGDVIGFAADGEGTNMHLVPRTVSGGSISLLVSHFSLSGASSGGASAASQMSTYTPGTTQQQAEQAIAIFISQGAGVNDPGLAVVLASWYSGSVRPGLQAAHGSGQQAFERAAAEWQAWQGYVQTLAPNLLQMHLNDASNLATAAAVELAGALLGRCTGFVDFRPPLDDVIRFAAAVELLALQVAGQLYQGRALPEGNNLPTACLHVEIESIQRAPAFAGDRGNDFTVNAGVVFWNGPVNHTLMLTYRLADATSGPPVPVDADTVGTGQWQTQITPPFDGLRFFDLTVELVAAATDDVLKALSARESFNLDVRDSVELSALGPVALRSGESVNLRVRLAGDGMEGGSVAYQLQGPGSLSQNGGTADVAGLAPQFSYTAPASGAGNAIISATFAGENDTLVVTFSPPVEVTVSPSSATLLAGEQRQFTATVQNATDPSVTWTATGGTITQGGLYTAGSNGGSFLVRARSNEDPNASVTASVEIEEAFGSVTFHLDVFAFDDEGNEIIVGFEEMELTMTSVIVPSGASFPAFVATAIVESYTAFHELAVGCGSGGADGPETITVVSPTEAPIWVSRQNADEPALFSLTIPAFQAMVDCGGQVKPLVWVANVCRSGVAVRNSAGAIIALDFDAPIPPELVNPGCTASGHVRFEPG